MKILNNLEQRIGWLFKNIIDSTIFSLIMAVSLFIISTIPIIINRLNHDVAWLFYNSERILDGARLYVDICDINPPLITYINAPPVWLARISGLSPIFLFKIYIFILVMLSLFLCWKVMGYISSPASPAVRRCLGLSLVALLLPFTRGDFAQREHIMLILVMPYILTAVGRAMGRRLDWRIMFFIGCLAGIGMALKPHFLLLGVVIDAYLTFVCRIRSHWRSPENLGIGLVLTIYGVMAIPLMPGYINMIQIAMQVYSSYDQPVTYLLRRPETILAAAAFITFILGRKTGKDQEFYHILLITSLSFLLIAFIQHKGWGYHFYPGSVAAILLIILIVLNFLEEKGATQPITRPIASAIMFLFIIGLFFFPVKWAMQKVQEAILPKTDVTTQMINLVRLHAHGEPIYILSSSAHYGFPLVNYSGASWPYRFGCLLMLPGLYKDVPGSEYPFPYHRRDEMNQVECFLIDALISDFKNHPPKLLIVDMNPDKQGFGKSSFDYIEYFLQNQDFAEIWENYEFLTDIESLRFFKRK